MHRCIAVLTLAILLTGLSGASATTVAIGFNGFGTNYVQMYDTDTDSATSVWSGTYMGGLAYDPEQDDVYFRIQHVTFDRLLRDNEPAVPGPLDIEYEVNGGIGNSFDFLSLDVAPQSQLVYSWRDPQGSSLHFARWTGIVARDVATNANTPLYSVPRYHNIGGLVHTNEIGGVAVDSAGEWVYFSDSIEGTMNRVLLDGTGGRQTLLSGLNAPGEVAVYGSNVYWTEWDGATGTISRSDLLGGGLTTLITPAARPGDIDVGEGRIYWTDYAGGPVNHSNLSGGDIQALGGSSPQATLVSLATPVPEPATLAIWSVLGGFGLIFAACRRRAA